MIDSDMIILLVILLGVLALSVLQQMKLEEQNTKLERIIMKLSELAGALETVNTQLTKIQAEVQALKDSLSNVDLPPEAQAALDKLVASVQAIDEINPDV